MAKKNFYDEDLTAREAPAGTAAKMPINVTGGKRSLDDYMEIPVGQLIPFRGKNGRDFKRSDKLLLEQMRESVKEDGIVEALTVRAIKRDQYEILAGETRWLMAREAGLESVPCHIVEADDVEASRVFTITNLLRRTLLPSDRINGWTLFHEAEKRAGRLGELRRAVDELGALDVTGEEPPTYRTIMYYVQMSRLIPEWLDRLDERKVAQKAARQISRLPEDKQRQLLPYDVSEEDARLLVDIASGKDEKLSWTREFLSRTLTPLSPPPGEAEAQAPGDATGEADATPPAASVPGGAPEAERRTGSESGRDPEADREQYQREKQFRKARPSIIRAARDGLRPSDYANAEAIIMQALTLYYKMLDARAGQPPD